jgi:hypothetical protein
MTESDTTRRKPTGWIVCCDDHRSPMVYMRQERAERVRDALDNASCELPHRVVAVYS